MRVEGYIQQLLYRYECVIVPGFGAFVTQKNTSIYNSRVHKFTPPTRSITFNKAIQNHDGLLAETIAKGESMDFESAKHKIQLFVNDFQTALQVDRAIEIPKLGTFYLDQEDKLSFEPLDKINYFVDSFGLDEMTLAEISNPVTENNSQADEKEKLRSLEPKTAEREITPVYHSEDKQKRPYLRYAAVGVIALSLASLAGLYQYNNYVISYNDTESQKAESLLQERIQSAEFSYTLPELPLNTAKVETLLPRYHIIAGAYRIESNAKKKVELLKAKGYDAVIIGKNSYGLHQVAFSSYVQKWEALQHLRKIKAIENPEAWLYVKQL
jgi:hypothetical protein